jgi:hypothetical protein
VLSKADTKRHPRGTKQRAVATNKNLSAQLGEEALDFWSTRPGSQAGIESAKLAGPEPRAYLREATMRSVRNPGTVTLTRDLKPPEP